jgi:cytoskeletal protein CcmA (bactofilin family)
MSILGGQAATPASSLGSAPTPGLPVAAGQGARSQLSAGVRIVGEFQAPGHLELGGRIEGVVLADSVVVEEQGEIRGEVRAGAVGVKGVFEGTLTGGAVRLHATARVAGTVLYDTLSVESGAEVTAAFKRNGG